ncbi:MAG: adenylate/guanylate cyclase domain-containing protein [Alphaproteobacteria bacterium]
MARLRDAGLPIARFVLSQPTLHPELRAVAYNWTEAKPAMVELRLPHGVETTQIYLNSPTRLIYDGADMVRRRLEGDEEPPFPILKELKAEGHTDYLARRLVLTQGRSAMVAISTRRQGGFTDGDLAMLDAVLPSLATVLELRMTWNLTATLLDTYVGHGAGERVLTGQIRRGSVETIPAVVWYCDMRGFTGLSDRLPGPFLIAVLNDFFETLAEPLGAQGGEVLKFIGDAMLAIFRIDERTSEAEACEMALVAAQLAIQGVRRLNRRRAGEDKPPLDFGLALHVGEVMYGNVGAPSRLDFTVTGPAVNLAARLEGMSGQLGRQLVVSSAFAACCPGEFVTLGRFPLKGMAEPQEIFAPA